MNTKKFRTRQEFFKNDNNPKGKDYIIALDAGYSSMKVFYENGHFAFPSYAKRLDGEMLSVSGPKDILYKDLDTGETYMLGYIAQEMIASGDTNDTDGELYSRKRYSNKKFKILCHAAIAMALQGKKDNREIVIQTGLPSSYVGGDAKDMIKALATPSHFALKQGENGWKEYNLSIKAKNIFCDMPQPAGSLYSIMYMPNGKAVPNAKDYLFGNVLVMDIGFGTFDFYGLKNRAVACKDSIDEIGMREVLKHTSKKILEELNEDIRVQALQKNLETGKVVCVNEEEMKTEEQPLGALLEAANEEVFKDAFERAKAVTNTFRDYQYIIIAGGTGEAWFEKIKAAFSGMKTIQIIPSNFNDKLPFIYSNVHGYYLFRYNLNSK